MTTLVILVLAILAGWLCRRLSIPKLSGRILTMLVCIMLLLLGMSVGADPDAVSKLADYGLNALIIGIAAAVGSAVAASIMYWLIRKRGKESER